MLLSESDLRAIRQEVEGPCSAPVKFSQEDRIIPEPPAITTESKGPTDSCWKKQDYDFTPLLRVETSHFFLWAGEGVDNEVRMKESK